METKFVGVSDLHGDLPDRDKLPPGDVLIIAGDVLPDDWIPPHINQVSTTRFQRQGLWFGEVFVPWVTNVKTKFEHVIFIGGNHDFFFEKAGDGHVQTFLPPLVHYLNNSSVQINGLMIHGIPWNMTSGWAFSPGEEFMDAEFQKLRSLPIDLMISHGSPDSKIIPEIGPAHTYFGSRAFSEWIVGRIGTLQAVVWGHIHDGFGIHPHPKLFMANLAAKDEKYRSVNPPISFTLKRKDLHLG